MPCYHCFPEEMAVHHLHNFILGHFNSSHIKLKPIYLLFCFDATIRVELVFVVQVVYLH